MRMIAILIVGLLTVASCAGRAFSDSYRFGIDPAFTGEQQDIVRSAIEDWQARVGLAQVVFTVSYGLCDRSENDHLVCIHPSFIGWHDGPLNPGGNPGSIGVSVWDYNSTSSDIYMRMIAFDPPFNPVFFKQSLLHEIGHSLGLTHCDELVPPELGRHIMVGDTGGASLDITCGDVQQFMSYRTYEHPILNDQCQDPKQSKEEFVPVQYGRFDY
jgi:hypothetical protein